MITTEITNENKNKSFLLSNQVKKILHQNGFSKVFNYNDYKFFKEQCKDAFNKAEAIANKFIEENESQSDFLEYEY